jgi:hypothetical protein
VARSSDVNEQGLIDGTGPDIGKGWLWIGEDCVESSGSWPGSPSQVLKSEISRVAEVRVLGGRLFESELAVSLADGTVIEGIPTRYGVASLLPFGRQRL